MCAAATADEQPHAKAVAGGIIKGMMIPPESLRPVVSGLHGWKRLLCGILASLPSKPIVDQSP